MPLPPAHFGDTCRAAPGTRPADLTLPGNDTAVTAFLTDLAPPERFARGQHG